jgi:hypothetical protein
MRTFGPVTNPTNDVEMSAMTLLIAPLLIALAREHPSYKRERFR